MRILITGGHGFIGRHVCHVLAERHHQVLVASRRDGLDLTDQATTDRWINETQPDAVINCAAHVGSLHYVTKFAADVIADNVQMTLNLYRSVARLSPHTRVINPLSNCAYPGDALIQRESEFWAGPVHHSVWAFGNAKRTLLVVSDCYAMQYGIRTLNFLVPNAYGPGDHADPNKTHALNGMIIRMLKARHGNSPEFEIWGTGRPTREWIYGPDAGRMLADSVETDVGVSPVNLAQNKAYSIADTAEMIKTAVGFQGMLRFNTSYADGAPTKQLDDTEFDRLFPNFRFTNMQEGIAATVSYYEHIQGLNA